MEYSFRVIIFSLISVLLFSIKPATSNNWIDSCMDYTIHSEFDSALAIIDRQIQIDSLNYQAYFYRAATLSSRMTHFENTDDEEGFISAIDRSIAIIEDSLQDTTGLDAKKHADYLFYLGSAYGYLAFYQGRNGKYFPALSNGLESNALLHMAVAMDSLRYDAFLGIGVFKYWRYSKLKFISWLPFIPDEREEGIFDNSVSDPVEREAITSLEIGMSMADAEKAIGFPGFKDSEPSALYSAKEGGYYYLVFYDPAGPADREVGLRYAVYFPAEDKPTGRYVLPLAKKGMPYPPTDR